MERIPVTRRVWAAVLLVSAGLFAHCGLTLADSDQEAVDILGAAGLSIAALGTTWSRGDGDGAWQFVAAFSITQIALKTMTNSIKHEGPNGSSNSFPSDHATAAFSGAAFLHQRYGWRAALPAYTLASATAANRVREGHHDWADVAAGAALAIGVNYWVVSAHGQMAVAPTARGDGGMVIFSMQF